MEIYRKGPILLDFQQRGMWSLSFSKEEVKATMWSIPEYKASGLDGLNNKFYKASWDIVGDDIVEAINQFFISGMMPKS